MRCQFDVAHGPTCYCHRPGTDEFRYGGQKRGEKRMLCLNHWNHEDMRLYHPKQFTAYLASKSMDATKFRNQL